ncbi:MAG: MoaD/ThiS family protein [Gammaproteobacteria bacterium]|nr:MoaD/ThiS family protein [Gammaproteobacteria bacterium]
MKIGIPSVLASYTDGARSVEAAGDTVAALLHDLDRRYPGIRFRMVDERSRLRPHVRIFLNGEVLRDLATPVQNNDEVVIMQALSGG